MQRRTNAQHSTAQHSTAQHSTFSEYQTRIIISQIHPEIDISWEERLEKIFSKTSKSWRTKISEEALSAKKISWDEEAKKFSHHPDPINFDLFVAEQCHEKLKPLGKWCIESIKRIKQIESALEIADLLENTINRIDNFDLDEYKDAESSRHLLRQNFIYEAAAAIKQKNCLIAPPNQRKLDTDVIKSFLNEVFLKQKLLGHGFAVLRKGQLSRMKQPLLKNWLCHQQSIRKLEVVCTTQFIFALANTFQDSINIFSARRFLTEEQIKNTLYLNGAFIRNDQISSREHCQEFADQIACIVSIGGQTSQAVVELLDKMEEFYFKRIIPQIFSPVNTHNTTLEDAIKRKLSIYSQLIETSIMKPFESCLLSLSGHQEDFSYLFLGMQQIMGQIMMDFREVAARPAMLKNNFAERLMVQLNAYADTLFKRRDRIFNRSAISEWNERQADVVQMYQEIRDALREVKKQFSEDQKSMIQLEQTIGKEGGFLDKILRRTNRRKKALLKAQEDLMKTKRMGYMLILNVLFKNKAHWLYMNGHDMLFLEGARCYAFHAEKGMLSKMPILFIMPDSYRDFNPIKCLNMLEQSKLNSSSYLLDDE
ncbi:hypothetical protein ABFV80_001375 [Vandammella animalimorsus]